MLSCWMFLLSIPVKKGLLSEGSFSEIRSFRWSGDVDLLTAGDKPLFCKFFSLTALVPWRPAGFICSVTGSMLSILAAERRSLTVFCSRAGKTARAGRWSAVVTCDDPLLSGEGMAGRGWRSLAIGGEKAVLLGGAPAGCGRAVLLGSGM